MFFSLLLPLVFVIVGLGLLAKGGDWTIDAAIYVARRFGISALLIGFTIVAFGTSLPELVVSVLAHMEGSEGIALGNVMGSNIANIFCVLAITAIIVPLFSDSKAVVRDAIVMVIVTGLLAALLLSGGIERWAGIGMLVLLVSYIFYQYRMAKGGDMPMEVEDTPAFSKPLYAYGFLILGLVSVTVGAEVLVRGAKECATIIGVPEAIIGLSVIALGTSLPELTTCLSAARKGHSGIVFGNIIGSNVFNILMILGLTAVIKPIHIDADSVQLVQFDIWVVGLVSVVFAGLLIFFKKVSRVHGILFLALYLGYNIYIYASHLGGLS